mgnify:CR=1 FL=1
MRARVVRAWLLLTLAVEARQIEQAAGREGWMHAAVAFAKPFRMPDFFLISGLFVANVIDRDWRTYLDRKVMHFAYFYVLWVTIQFAFKAPSFAADMGWIGVAKLYALSFIDPFGTQMRASGIGKVISWGYIDTIPGQPNGAFWARAPAS